MAFIVDASVALCWLIPGQENPASIATLRQALADGGVVPALWHLEVANQLGRSLRHRTIAQVDLNIAFELIQRIDLHTDSRPWTSVEVVSLMTEYQLTAYDAVYLELAIRLRLPLATFDRELIAAAPRAGVSLIV